MLNHIFKKLLHTPDIAEKSHLTDTATIQKWTLQLSSLHEYEAHQKIIALLKEFNEGHSPFEPQRLHVLGIIEQAGSKFQYGLITQFLSNHANMTYSGKSLWKEIISFYWQLALAYQVLTNAALHGGEQGKAALPSLVLRSIHYQGKLMQWRYLHYELPTAQIWHAIHKLYRLAEQHGFAHDSMVLKGSAYCTCEQAYARVLLLHLMSPVGLNPNELELAAYWAWKWRDEIKLLPVYHPDQHQYCVVLAESLPPQPIYGRALPLESVRYWSMHEVLNKLTQTRLALTQRQQNIKLYNVPFADDPKLLLLHIQSQFAQIDEQPALNRINLRNEIAITCGNQDIIHALNHPQQAIHVRAFHQATGHPIEQYYRLNLPANTETCPVSQHDLLLVYNEDASQIASIAAVRWLENSGSKITTLGLAQLGALPKTVTICAVHDALCASPFNDKLTSELMTDAIYLTQSAHLIALHAIDSQYYDMLTADYVYRIRVRAHLEQQYDWVRVKFDILTRTHLTRLPTSPM
ncbi:MAG: hypothetical protein HOP20_00035 [Sulfuriferula sp.]|nr:hypothetical protein [Sulfuriferula sp.]